MEPDQKTVVAEPRWVAPALLVGFPLAGGAVAWGLQAAAAALAAARWVPRRRLIEWLAEQPSMPRLVVAIGVGAVLGLLLGLTAVGDLAVLTVRTADAVLVRGKTRLHVPRAAVASVFRDGKDLVVLDQQGEERWRVKTTLESGLVREAFLRHGYPWRDGAARPSI